MGDVAVSEAKETAKLICIAEDLAPGSRKRAERVAEKSNLQVLTLPFKKEEIGWGLGRKPCGILALTDEGFACEVIKAIAGEAEG